MHALFLRSALLSFTFTAAGCFPMPPAAPAQQETTSAEAPQAEEAKPAASAPTVDWNTVTPLKRPNAEPNKNAALAGISRTPKSELKSFSEAELKAAAAQIKPAMPWEEATKRVVAQVGNPAYSVVAGAKNATFLQETWVWASALDAERCTTFFLRRSGNKVDMLGDVGTYWVKGHAAHASEYAAPSDPRAGHLHMCEGVITEKP